MKKYEHKEDDVARALGLTREYVAELRQSNLIVDEDVAVVAGCIRYSDAGIRKLTDILGLQKKTAGDKPDDGPVITGPAIAGGGQTTERIHAVTGAATKEQEADVGEETLQAVERRETAVEGAGGSEAVTTPVSKKNVLAGRLDAVVTRIYANNRQYLEATLGDQAIVIRARSNEHFVPGMIVESRWLARVNERVFDFVGRCPRGRGKW